MQISFFSVYRAVVNLSRPSNYKQARVSVTFDLAMIAFTFVGEEGSDFSNLPEAASRPLSVFHLIFIPLGYFSSPFWGVSHTST